MPRSLVIGNGNILVGYESSFSVRDLYWPHVGDANQTMGNVCRTGVWVDGQFAWFGDADWEREIGYQPGGLVAKARLTNRRLGVVLELRDWVDMARDWFFRSLDVIALKSLNEVRVFFHYDWYLGGSDIGNTVLWEPRHHAIVAYKDSAYFLLGGEAAGRLGPDSWATGKKGADRAGTWVDAEDGSLGRNPIDQGSVDCVIEFDLGAIGESAQASLIHWVCMGPSLHQVTHFGQDLIRERGAQSYLNRTQRYWEVWSDKGHETRSLIERELGPAAHELYRQCVLISRAHCDRGGGVIAATDYDITKFARDTYSYVWPRDGALVANALDRAGHEDVTRRFFEFCRSCLTPDGFLLHKYTPAGVPGSSWHPWIDAQGGRVLPIQEDETGLVLWALWEHFQLHRNLDFVADLYSSLVLPAGRWLAAYTDPKTGLPLPSWDLWEERWGVHAFTVGAVWAGLGAAAKFAQLFADPDLEALAGSAQSRLKEAADLHLYRPELGRFARRLTVEADGSLGVDPVIDSAIYGLWRFGMLAPDEPRLKATMVAIGAELGNRAAAAGVARYSNDYYFQVEHDLALAPGNPWFICTMWMGQWYAAVARGAADLDPVRATIQWVLDHQMPGGVLSEQVDPHTGAPLSVSPLTWSQAEFVVTVDDFLKASRSLRARGPKPPPI